MTWVNAHTSDGANLFWLRGHAGAGKTTIANTLAKRAQRSGYPLACFFCKRDDQSLSNASLVLPTLAYRFAQQDGKYRQAIYRFVHTDSGGAGVADTMDIDTQFDLLFRQRLKLAKDSKRPFIVIVDALDESSPNQQAILAKNLLALSRLSPWIKVFVTSRADPTIERILNTDACVQRDINKETGTKYDIRQYIDSQLQNLEISLPSTQIEALVDRAEGLFIWCTTLFKMLTGSLSAENTLDTIISGAGERGEAWSGLYQLYDVVLDAATLNENDRSFMRVALSVIGIASRNRPLSPETIMSFLHDHPLYSKSHKELAGLVKKLHAVLYVDGSVRGAVRAYHTSFYDYLEHKAIQVGSRWEPPFFLALLFIPAKCPSSSWYHKTEFAAG